MSLQAASYMLLINKSVVFFVHARIDKYFRLYLTELDKHGNGKDQNKYRKRVRKMCTSTLRLPVRKGLISPQGGQAYFFL